MSGVLVSFSYGAAVPAPYVPPALPTTNTGNLPANLGDPRGADVSVFPVMGGGFPLISGRRVVLEACLKRLQTRRGMLWNHPDFGLDLRDYIGEAVTDAVMAQLRTDVAAEIEKEERVLGVEVGVIWVAQSQRLYLTLTIYDGNGPFSLTLQVTQLSVDVVSTDVTSTTG
jgi:hypothetical protein